MGPAMTSNTRESGVQTTTVHAVAMRTAAFKTVQCNELNVTALYILITKQINKAYKYYLWWQPKQVYIHLHQFLYRFHFLMRHIVDSNKRWSIRVILEYIWTVYFKYKYIVFTSGPVYQDFMREIEQIRIIRVRIILRR